MRRRAVLTFLAALAGAAVPVSARAGDVVVPDDALVAAAVKVQQSTVVLRVTRGDETFAATTTGLEGLRAHPWTLIDPSAPRDTVPVTRVTTKDGDGNLVLRFIEGGVRPPEVRGVFVGDGHVIATAVVAIEGATKIEVVREGTFVEAVLAGLDRDFDVAVLRTSVAGPPLEVDATAELEPGRLVVLPAATEAGGVDVRFVASRGGVSPRRGYARLSTSLPAASVGAPALGPDGRVRGLVVGPAGLGDEIPRITGWTRRFGYFAGRGDDPTAVAHLLPGRRLARAVRDLLVDGRVRKAYLGVVLDRADAGQDARRVAQVLPGAPAEGRLRAGDRIVAVGARELAAFDDVTYEILALEPGRPARVVVERVEEGRPPARVEVEVTPTERREDASARGPLVFGFDVLALTPELKAWMGRAEGEGLVISSVTHGGAAERAGFARGDRVLRLAGRAVASQDDLAGAIDDALRSLAAGTAVVLEVERDGQTVSGTLHPAAAAAPAPPRTAGPR